MSKTRRMKIYCSMHDTLINSNERDWDAMEEVKIPCVCCGRYYSGDSLHAFELYPEITQKSTPCNCFFDAHYGFYRQEEIDRHHHYRPLKEVVHDLEESEKDNNASENANGCKLHEDCENPECEGIYA